MYNKPIHSSGPHSLSGSARVLTWSRLPKWFSVYFNGHRLGGILKKIVVPASQPAFGFIIFIT